MAMYNKLHNFYKNTDFIMASFERQFDRFLKIGWDEDTAVRVIIFNFTREYFDKMGITPQQFKQFFDLHHNEPSFNYENVFMWARIVKKLDIDAANTIWPRFMTEKISIDNVDVKDPFEDYYDEHNLAENSQYSDMGKKQLVIEAEYLHNSLCNILKYIDNGGVDIDVVKAEVYDGIYESRI